MRARWSGVLLFAVIACDDPPPPSGKEPATSASSPVARPSSTAEKFTDAEIDAEQIPTPQDHEEAMQTEITVENYRAELDKVAAELEEASPSATASGSAAAAPASATPRLPPKPPAPAP